MEYTRQEWVTLITRHSSLEVRRRKLLIGSLAGVTKTNPEHGSTVVVREARYPSLIWSEPQIIADGNDEGEIGRLAEPIDDLVIVESHRTYPDGNECKTLVVLTPRQPSSPADFAVVRNRQYADRVMAKLLKWGYERALLRRMFRQWSVGSVNDAAWILRRIREGGHNLNQWVASSTAVLETSLTQSVQAWSDYLREQRLHRMRYMHQRDYAAEVLDVARWILQHTEGDFAEVATVEGVAATDLQRLAAACAPEHELYE